MRRRRCFSPERLQGVPGRVGGGALITIGGLYFPDGERHFQRFADNIADYQRPQRDRAFTYVRDWSLALDVGANIGIFSRHFAEKFEEVWAIEPLQANIECLEKNVPSNVLIKQFAIGDKTAKRTIYQTPNSLGGAFISDDDGVPTPSMTLNDKLKVEVDMVTIDSFELRTVGLIKLDIQGSEVIAIKGAEETLRRCRPVVLIEEKPLGGPTGSVTHIHEATALLLSFGMIAKELVGADRVYIYE